MTAHTADNAALIAAAPDMLAALRETEMFLLAIIGGSGPMRGSAQTHLEVVRAAIAKAAR